MKQLARPQLHLPGKKNFGKLRDPRVVGSNVVVEELAAIRNALLQFRDALLKGKKIPVRLEIRIALSDRKQRMQRAGQPNVRLRLLWNTGRSDRSRTRQRDRFQRLTLMIHISLDA